MSNPVLFRHRDIKPVNDAATTDAMLRVLVEISVMDQQCLFYNDEKAGSMLIYENRRFPNRVVEYIKGRQDDSVTTLYESNHKLSFFASLIEVRKELINEIGAVLMMLPGAVTVFDAGRERKVFLSECGTAQLIDLLAAFTNTDLKSL